VNGIPVEEENQRSNLMILPAILENQEGKISTYAMVDTGAEGKGFIDEEWALDHCLKLCPLQRSIALEVFDGREAESGRVTHYVEMSLRIHDHYQARMRFYVTRLAHYPIVLGMPWLKEHDPFTRYAANTIMFNSEYCYNHCNTPSRPTKLRALSDIPPRSTPRHLPPRPLGLAERDITAISLRACTAYIRRNYYLFTVTVEDINAALSLSSALTHNLKDVLPSEFRDFTDVFSPKEAKRLPPYRPYNHNIKL
jgi:hypothetical protein